MSNASLDASGGSFRMVATLTAEEGGVWVVRVEKENGKVQEYRCASEQLAKQLAAVLAPRDAR